MSFWHSFFPVMCGLPDGYAQPVEREVESVFSQIGQVISEQTGPYYTNRTILLYAGTIIGEDIINGPPKPPPGFEFDRNVSFDPVLYLLLN